ncbi:MAG: hypothetical protein ABJQ71_14290 [Roseibium sp.]
MAIRNSDKVRAQELNAGARLVAIFDLDGQPAKRHDRQKWSDQRGPNPLVMLGLDRS